MAYNQSAAYRPPRQDHHGQYRQAPAQAQYGGYSAQHDQYGGYDQPYDQGYGGYDQYQQHGGYDDYSHGMNSQHGQYYGDNGMQNGYGYDQYDQGYPPQDAGRQHYGRDDRSYQANGWAQPNQGYGDPRQNGRNPHDRNYDPRYQQRPGRDPRAPPNGAPAQRPPTSGSDYNRRPAQPDRQDSRNGQPTGHSGYPNQAPVQQERDMRNGYADQRRPNGEASVGRKAANESHSGGRHPDPAPQKPKMSAMEEWKAKEKAKMHEAAGKPKIVPQDNAFPTFPSTSKEEKARGTKSARSSEEQARPSSSGNRHGSRPGSSRSNEQKNGSPPRDAAGGQSHHQVYPTRGGQSFDPIQEQPMQEYSQQQTYDQYPQQQGERNGQPPLGSSRPYQQQTMRGGAAPQGYGDPASHPRDRVQQQPSPINTQQPYAGAPINTQQHVISPIQGRSQHVPQPQPTAAHRPDEQRRKPVPHAGAGMAYHAADDNPNAPSQRPNASGTQAYAQTHHYHEPNVAHATQSQLDQQQTLDDLYDDYLGDDQADSVAVPPPPKNREEEIEAEMPDFDSAAPGQTSSLHKRQETVDKHLAETKSEPAPPLPGQQVNGSAQSLPAYSKKPYTPADSAVASEPDLTSPGQGRNEISDGFVFGVPGEQVRASPQHDYAQQPPPRQQPMGYRPPQSAPPEDMRKHQSPVNPRQMQMPMRGGPPPGHPQANRFHPGGQGPLPPQQRSASTRPPMAQGGWSDPGQQRVPTAPPMHQGPPGGPPRGVPPNGRFLDEQHRAPSAPPAQQSMRGMPPAAPLGHPPNGQMPQQQRRSDPDTLPHHPTPFRPGLMEQQGAPQPPKPAPVRNYDNRSSSSSHTRQPSISDKPITKADLEQARIDAEASPASPRLALRYAKKLVEASHVLASEGGRLDAKMTQRNREKYLNDAYRRVKDLVRNSYPEAQFFMAECYGSGELGLQVDSKEAFALYQAAAKGGHAAAAFRTAVSCEIGPEEGGGTRRDYPKAVQWYRRAAALGDAAAMYKLGIVLLRGLLGVPRNVGEAHIWLKRAAERADKDNPHALHELATLHDPATVDPEVRAKVLPDEAYALSLFRRAAEYGFKRAQFRLGQAYEYGILGLDIDNRASIAWYTKAAAQGEHNAELALSGWYLTGADGMLEQSDMEAYLWARKAAQSEPPLAKAMFAMGYFTEQGIGCPKSLEEAKRWYGRAASLQFPKALERLEELRKGGKNKAMSGKLTRDKKKDDENCVVM